MRLPRHKSPTQGGLDGTAPYNFVPLPDAVVTVNEVDIPFHDKYEHHTGYLDCTLTTKTPLYVRGAMGLNLWAEKMSEQKQDDETRQRLREEYAQFFHVDNPQIPVIPGSSLRGMIRGLLEIVSYGKIAWVTDKQLFFRTMDGSAVSDYYVKRMGDNVEAGFLCHDDNDYYIQTCKIIRVKRDLIGGKNKLYGGKPPSLTPQWNGKYHQYQTVWVELNDKDTRVEKISPTQIDNWLKGCLVITGDIPGKNNEFVFLLPSVSSEKIAVAENIILRFHDDDQITQWQEKAFPVNKPVANGRKRDGYLRHNLKIEGDPVFFLRENNQLTFLGRAKMFRLPYENSPYNLIPLELKDDTKIDLVDAIFGYIPKTDKDMGRAGRVFFCDAHYQSHQGSNIWLPLTTLKVLGSPKPTAFQNYLTQDDGKNHNPNYHKRLAHYDTPADETTIRGHKQYWHQRKTTSDSIKEEQEPDWLKDTQHTQIIPVDKGITFNFRVHFENLKEYELGALLWVLDLPDNHCHKLGMGKPLGLGSVAIKPSLVLTNRASRYTQLFTNTQDNWNTSLETADPPQIQALKATFESEILTKLTKLGVDITGKHLAEQYRVKTLLHLLNWNGADTLSLKYMPIDTRSRPVLPMPLEDKESYASNPNLLSKPQQKTTKNVNDASTELLAESISILNTINKSAQTIVISSSDIPQVDDPPFQGIVKEITANGDIIVQHPKKSLASLEVIIPVEHQGNEVYKLKGYILCKVIAVKGESTIICEPYVSKSQQKKKKKK